MRGDAFWSEAPSANPPLTPTMVQEVETQLGIKLPAEFVALLQFKNGGYTRGYCFPTSSPTSWSKTHVPFDEMFGIGSPSGPVGHQNIYDTGYMTEEWGLPQNQVLLSGDGHWWITLDYRSPGEPRVSWVDVERSEELELAPSFAAFVSGLRPSSTFEAE